MVKHSGVIEYQAGHGAGSEQVDRPALLVLAHDLFANRFIGSVKGQRWQAFRRSTGVLLILNLILLALIALGPAVDTESTASLAAVSDLEADGRPELALEEFHIPSRDFFDVISDRPLFYRSRRPILKQPVKVEFEDVKIELLGTFLSATQRAALVRLGTQEHAEWVREREYLSSWQVERILANRIRIRRMDELRIIDLWPKAESLPG